VKSREILKSRFFQSEGEEYLPLTGLAAPELRQRITGYNNAAQVIFY
jgi:hypothetical protein